MDWWNTILIADPRALALVRVILIGMLVVMAVTTKSAHLRLASILYALWKIEEYISNPKEMLTLAFLLLAAIQCYFFWAVFFGIERMRLAREENQRLRQAVAKLSASP